MCEYCENRKFKDAFRKQFYPDYIRERCKDSHTEVALVKFLMRRYRTADLDSLTVPQLRETNGVVSMWIDMMNDAIESREVKVIRPRRWNK